MFNQKRGQFKIAFFNLKTIFNLYYPLYLRNFNGIKFKIGVIFCKNDLIVHVLFDVLTEQIYESRQLRLVKLSPMINKTALGKYPHIKMFGEYLIGLRIIPGLKHRANLDL